MTLVSLAIIPVAVIISKIHSKENHKNTLNKQQDYLGHVNGQVEEIYGGHTYCKSI